MLPVPIDPLPKHSLKPHSKVNHHLPPRQKQKGRDREVQLTNLKSQLSNQMGAGKKSRYIIKAHGSLRTPEKMGVKYTQSQQYLAPT